MKTFTLFFFAFGLCFVPKSLAAPEPEFQISTPFDEKTNDQPSLPHPFQPTAAQKQWLAQHPVIRVGFDPAWPPFSFSNKEGHFEGLDLDLLHLIEARLGIHFDLQPAPTWEETLQKAYLRQIDCISGTAFTPERARQLTFTPPYISFPIAIISRQDAPFLTTLRSLRGQVLASPRGYVTTERLLKEFPGMPLVQTKTTREALHLLAKGRADAMVENLATTSYLIKSDGLTNLKISGVIDERFDLRFGVRHDWPELQTLLSQASASITESEWNTIFHHWILVDYPLRVDWDFIRKFIAFSLLGALLIISLFLYWNRRLALELQERRKIEEQLRAARDRLEQISEEKTRFMSMAAHDLNNPLAEIVMKCDLLKLQQNYETKFIHSNLDQLQEVAMRMGRLIRNLLNITAIEQGKNLLRMQRLNLSQMAQESVNRFRGRAAQKKIQLLFQNTIEPCEIMADPDAAAQILDNLISNAIKYSPTGQPVNVKVGVHGAKVRFTVQDKGPGIRGDEMSSLFGAFNTLSAKPTGNEPSHGLGLAIVKALCEAMQARVWCESEAGQGSSFALEIALAPAETDAK